MRKLDLFPAEADVVESWNSVAAIRERQIASGSDLSYSQFVKPALIQQLANLRGDVLDVGCGTGDITAALSATFDHALGIDFSTQSIEIAHLKHLKANLRFECRNALEFYGSQQFDVVVSNMFLMDVPSLEDHVRGIAQSMRPSGTLVASFLHPCFWPHYWRYIDQPWFHYMEETPIAAEFRTSTAGATGVDTVHVHRPLSQYVQAFLQAGLHITGMFELRGAADDGDIWARTPRYLMVRAASNR